MKKIIILLTILVLAGLVLVGGSCFDKNEPIVDDEPIIEDSWIKDIEKKYGKEDESKRTAYTRTYAHPTDPNKGVTIQVGEVINPEQAVFGDTNTTSTNNKDTMLWQADPTYNWGITTVMTIFNQVNIVQRAIMDWTLSAGSGTITDVKLYLYVSDQSGVTGDNIDIHELTQAFVEGTKNGEACATGASWNKYNCGTNWSSAGGDYDGTIIDTIVAISAGSWVNFVLMGTGATNPLTLDWEDSVDFLIKFNDETESGATDGDNTYNSKENASNKPYFEITFELPAAGGRTIIEE